MIVPFVNFGRQYRDHKSEYDEAIQGCLDKGKLILQEDLEKFEERFAKLHGAEYAIGVGSGSDALYLSLLALEVGEEDEVTVPGYTFKASMEAIMRTGATVKVVDVGDDRLMHGDYSMVMPVHIEGGVSNATGSKVTVEDACQAVTTKLTGDTACFSFYPAKILGGFGDGGAVVTNSKLIADKVRLYRHHWQTDDKEKVGYTSRLDNVQAAFLNVKMKYLPEIITKRREIAWKYDIEFGGLPIGRPHARHIYQDYVILVDDPDGLRAILYSWGIETLLPPAPPHITMDLGYELPRTEEIFAKSIRLPLNETLTDQQVDYVISKVRAFYG